MCTKELIELGLWLSRDDEDRVELERQRLSLQSSIQQQENRFMHELEERRSFPAQLEKLQTKLSFLRCDLDLASEVYSAATSVSLVTEEADIDSIIADYASLLSRLREWEKTSSHLLHQAQENCELQRSLLIASHSIDGAQQEELVKHQVVESVLTGMVLQVAMRHEACALVELESESEHARRACNYQGHCRYGMLRPVTSCRGLSDFNRKQCEQSLQQRTLQVARLRSVLENLQREEDVSNGDNDRVSLKIQHDSTARVIATWKAQKESFEAQLSALRTACDDLQAEIEQERVAIVDAQTSSAVASSSCRALEMDYQSLRLREAACNFGSKAENLCMDVEDAVARIVRMLDGINTLMEKHQLFRMHFAERLVQFTVEDLNLHAELSFARRVSSWQSQRLASLSEHHFGGKSNLSIRGQARSRKAAQRPAARTLRKPSRTRKQLSSLIALRAEYSKAAKTLSTTQERVRHLEEETKRISLSRYRSFVAQQLHSKVSAEWKATLRATEDALLLKDKKFQKDLQSRGQQLQAECSRARRERNALMQKLRSIE